VLLRAYASGIFPMADSAESPDIFWVEPKRRGVLPLDKFHLSKSLAKTLRSERFTLTVDRAFDAVLAACAEPVPGRTETWINPLISQAYRELHKLGHAHSVEAWTDDGMLAGFMGFGSAAHSSGNRCSPASATAQKWRWLHSSRG
jgi:leucyl/phenylalanyl-tRNA--protein transferase